MRNGSGATDASARFSSITRTTAAPTLAGDFVRRPIGRASPVSAHIPESWMGPGYTIDTPTPKRATSPRSESAYVRSADFVALYSDRRGVGKAAASDETNTR